VEYACRANHGAAVKVLVAAVLEAFVNAKLERTDISTALYAAAAEPEGAAVVRRAQKLRRRQHEIINVDMHCGGIARCCIGSISQHYVVRERQAHGGAILNGGLFQSAGTLTMSNSTLSENAAGDGDGGGIFNVKGSTAVLQNSIVANNTGGNCHGALTSNGYNLSSDGSCTFNGTGDLNNTDPKLGTLGNHGGPTQTIALLKDSRRLMPVTRVAAPMARVIC
jgi:hypothetical protein